jgi:ribonuclease P protein component
MATAPERGGRKAASSVLTLKRRAEFLATRKGGRWATPHFVLEGMARDATGCRPTSRPRFGFTVSKQVGGAVERNRIRRRLKAVVRDVQADHARPDFDYVVIARRPALEAGFSVLVADLVKALERVHAPPRPSGTRGRERSPKRA